MPRSNPLRHRWLRAAPALVLAFVAACRADGPAKPGLDVSTFERLAGSDVVALRLEKVRVVALGSPAEGINTITDLSIQNGFFYVLDRSSKSIKVIDQSGRAVRTIGRPGRGPGEFTEPMSLAFAAGRMFVADPRAGKRLSVFDGEGRFLEQKEFDTPTVPVRLAVDGDRIATMGILTVADPHKQGWDALTISTLDGRAVGRGCVIDARYIESANRDGLLAHYDFGSVAARDGLIYCIQGISPVVQVMDRAGKPVRQIRLAPPFYAAPKDRKMTTNQKAIFDFIGSFTSHAAFFPVADGFVSAYSRFDNDAGELSYDLMACRGEPNYRCGTVRNVHRPLYVDGDTVYMEEEAQPNQPAMVGIYHLAGLDR